MHNDTFRALVLDEHVGKPQATLRRLRQDELPDGDVVIKVAYSSLNYKDGLAITGHAGVVRRYPLVPGIDLAGTVLESSAPAYQPGDQVVLTGWGVGEEHWGGMAELARVRAEWLVPLPGGLEVREAMGIGTAGLTGMLCVMALEEHGLAPGGQEVVVTGAAGGVGSMATAILAQAGYAVAAATGRSEERLYLESLGACRVLDRTALMEPSSKPLGTQQWAAAVDSVGGATLAGLLRAVEYGGSVAACGLAGGSDLHTTVLPFILRGVNLLGIDSVRCPFERRRSAWQRLAQGLDHDVLDRITQVVPLAEVPRLSEEILRGQVRGRIIVDLSA